MCTFNCWVLFADVAEKVSDRCSEKEHIYEFLEDFKPMPWPCFQRSEHNDIERGSHNQNEHWGPKKFDRSNHPLAIMVSCDVHIGEVLSVTSFIQYNYASDVYCCRLTFIFHFY